MQALHREARQRQTSIRSGLAARLCLGILVSSALLASATTRQEAAESLLGLLDQRLSLVEEIALSRAQQDLAIGDESREATVRRTAAEAASRCGIDVASAEHLAFVQMALSRDLQQRILADSSGHDLDATSPRSPDQELRPALDELDARILREASGFLARFGAIEEADLPLLGQQLHDRSLTPKLGRQLLEALAGLKLSTTLPEGFVDVHDVAPGVQYELRYLGDHNFLGTTVDGYFASRLILTEPTARALAEVQADLEPFGLGLLVFDAYRPQRAVDHFVRWAKDLDDTQRKQEHYPDVPKSELFEQGYIARRSGHSRGSTVDLTIVALTGPEQGQTLDMGGAFDLFSPLSWPMDASRAPQQRANRLLLRTLMIKHGFAPYSKEWWHFTLVDEPFPDTYFDFPVVREQAPHGSGETR